MRLLPVLLVMSACSTNAGKEPFGPIPGIYPIVPADDLNIENCEEAHFLSFEFSEDAQIVARGNRDERLIETWKMMSQGETYVWDLESPECTVTIPAADAQPNFPSWACEIGGADAFYTIKDDKDKKHYATAAMEMRIEGAWVAEDLMEILSYETILECTDGECDFWDDWMDGLDYDLPCENRYGYRATWAPEE